MRKFTVFLFLSIFILTAYSEQTPRKIAVGGRSLSTMGKTHYGGDPHPNLIYSAASSQLTYDNLEDVATTTRPGTPSKIISASGTDLQGFLKASSSPDYPKGWYDINTNGEVRMMFTNSSLMGSCGYVRDDRICQFTTISNYGYYWFYYSEYSLETGEQLYEIELPDNDMRNYVVNCTYDEKDDLVYMQTYSKNFNAMAWSTFNPSTRERVYLNNTLSWDDNHVVAIGSNPRDGRIYGVKENGDYVEIDRSTGETVKISTIGVQPAEYSQSMVYAPIERGFVWAAMLSDNTSGFYRIVPSTGETTLLGKMPAQNQFLMLWCPDKDASDNAPGMPEMSISFNGPSLEGTVSVSLPTNDFSGAALPGGTTVTAEVEVDGNTVASLKGKPGEKLTAIFNTTQGEHTSATKCRIEGDSQWGPERRYTFYAGHDTPLPPRNVRIKGNTISWDLPEGSVHGGYVNPDNLRFSVSLNDIPVAESGISETSVTFSEPSSLAIYYARVTAQADGMCSEPGISQGVKYGSVMEAPFSFVPTPEEFKLFTIVDGNHDGNKWRYFDGKDCVYYNKGNSGASDEYLIFPPADFYDTEHLYRLSFEARSLLSTRPEDFEILLLDDLDPTIGTVGTIASFQAYGKDDWTPETLKFNVEEPGNYRIAFHCTTQEGFQLMLRSFRCEKTPDTMGAPAECKGVKIEGAQNGRLEATASFIAPTKTLEGKPLDSSVEITVFARTQAGEGSVKVLPGQKGAVTFPCLQGNNNVTLVTANDKGEGIERYYNVFTGQEKPGKVQNLKVSVSDDNLSMTITWDPPTEGENGGYINPDDVGYYIYNVAGDELSFLEDIGKSRSYTLSVAPGQQSLQQLAVAPYNIAGASSSDTFRGTSAILGTPLQVPFTETFGYGIPRYLPNVVKRLNASYTAQWGHGDPTAIVYDAITPDYGCMYAQPSAPGVSLGRVEIPRVSTAGYRNICFRMNAFRFPQGGLIRILGRACDSDAFVEIGEFNSSKGAKGYVESVFKLPETLQNRPWIALAIEAEFDCESTNSFIIIDEYSLLDLPDNDLAILNLEGNDRLKAGETGKYTCSVINRGRDTQTASVLWEVLDSDGNVVATESAVVSPLEPEESETSEFSFTATGMQMGKCLTVRATVIADQDDSEANNTRTMGVALISAGSGTVDDLRASVLDNVVTLEWTAPQMKTSSNEDFSGLENGAYSAELGMWKNIDRDGKSVCSINGVELPDAGVAKGWQVIDESLHSLFTAHRGSKMLLAMTPADESAANDWLISPAVAGGSEVIFSANIISGDFKEEFELLVSDTDDSPASFRNLASFSKGEAGWETYMVKLPSDTRFFAIRYCSVDQFGMMIDDIDFVPQDAPERTVTGYNIYRNGSQVGTSPVDIYEDTWMGADTDYYIIPLVTENGKQTETVKSNVAHVATSGVDQIASRKGVYGGKGCIVVSGFEGESLSVFSVDGTCVASVSVAFPIFTVPAECGIYVVKCGGATTKITVR